MRYFFSVWELGEKNFSKTCSQKKKRRKGTLILYQSLLNRTLTLWGEERPFPPLEFFWEVFLFKMGPPKFFCMFSSKFVVLKKILGFSTFVVAEIFWVKNWKILAFSKNPIFYDQKLFFLKKKILVVKNRVFGKGQNFKIFQFLTHNISATTNVENSKIFFRTTKLLENMQKNFGGASLNKNASQKNSRGGGPFPLRELTCDLREIDIKWRQLFQSYRPFESVKVCTLNWKRWKK